MSTCTHGAYDNGGSGVGGNPLCGLPIDVCFVHLAETSGGLDHVARVHQKDCVRHMSPIWIKLAALAAQVLPSPVLSVSHAATPERNQGVRELLAKASR